MSDYAAIGLSLLCLSLMIMALDNLRRARRQSARQGENLSVTDWQRQTIESQGQTIEHQRETIEIQRKVIERLTAARDALLAERAQERKE